MKKRLLSVLLAFVLAFGFVSPALAADIYLPATEVQVGGYIGYGASLHIKTAIFVQQSYYNNELTEFPELYLLEDGVLTLVRECTASDSGINKTRHYDADNNPLPWCAMISVVFTEAEYNAFDLTADYVIKVPADAYKDEAGNLIGEKYVSFSGADIELFRYELTLFGQIHQYLWSLNETPLFKIFISPLVSFMSFLINTFNIPLTKPLL